MQNSIVKEFKSIKNLVMHVLESDELSRSNDNRLFVKCAELLGITNLTQLEDVSNLNLISVYKTRQLLQNKHGLFKPSEEVVNVRKMRNREIKQYMVAN